MAGVFITKKISRERSEYPDSEKKHRRRPRQDRGRGWDASQVAQWSRVCLQCRRHRFDPRVRKIPWGKEGQPTPVFLPGESRGQRSPVGYTPRGHKESDTTE